MNNLSLCIFSLMLTMNLYGNTDCLEERFIEIGKEISYPKNPLENGIEGEMFFFLDHNEFVVDTIKSDWAVKYFYPPLKSIDWNNLFQDCPNKDTLQYFSVNFTVGRIDTTYFENYSNRLQICRRDSWYILDPAREEAYFYTNTKMKINRQPSWNGSLILKKGRNTVFKYLYFHEESPYVHDDEKIEGIYFQIPRNIQEFHFKDEELVEIKLLYEYFGGERRTIRKYIGRGEVKGKLVNDEWLIDLKIADLAINTKFLLKKE